MSIVCFWCCFNVNGDRITTIMAEMMFRTSLDSSKDDSRADRDLQNLWCTCMFLTYLKRKYRLQRLRRMNTRGQLRKTRGWQLQTCILFHLYYLRTTFSLFPDSSLSRICNALNAFPLFQLFQDIPSYSQGIVLVWQYKSHLTSKQPFHPLSPMNRLYQPLL